ncbi:MATE family efflux transporter [Fusobacterium polymorphum]|uniref:MATE family efflux transporter n=1 Tax=Fusobacterium nucleatum subsp. polymorphum TaxID=76857 RepID=A0A2C6B303_FUSNP|nr:MATE family efflux transporter [Fusobacterium polymorphum]PHH98553.1 MATE family efflux transporter [Fusobacterium polymorphum]PIM76630.1 MATE family efflux transporter [Fusobacterium polymorphum]
MSHKEINFTEGSIIKKLISFMIPILGSLILQAMYGAVDLLIVGRFGTTAGLSGVSTGSQILNFVTFIITAFAMGVTVLISRYLGEKKPKKIGKIIGGATILFTAISVVLCIIMIIFARPISILMQAPKEALELTILYVQICGAGIFFIVAYNVISAIFRGLGDSKSPLIFVAIACVVNIVGDFIFVAIFNWNVVGAALATVIAQAVSVVISLIIMKKKSLPFTIKKKDFYLNREVKRFMIIGTPLALQEFLTQMSFLALCAFVNRLGLEASSGYGVACKVVNFVMLVPSALMQSMTSIVSQNVGAKKEKRAVEVMTTGMKFGGIIGTVVFLLIYFQGASLISIFTEDSSVIQKGYEYLLGFAPETILTAILFSFIGYFNGHENTIWVMIQGFIQTILVRLPFAYYMSIQENASLTKIGLAAPVATFFAIILNLVFYFKNKKRYVL